MAFTGIKKCHWCALHLLRVPACVREYVERVRVFVSVSELRGVLEIEAVTLAIVFLNVLPVLI